MASFIVGSIQIKTYSKVMLSLLIQMILAQIHGGKRHVVTTAATSGIEVIMKTMITMAATSLSSMTVTVQMMKMMQAELTFHIKCNTVFLKSFCFCFRILHQLFFHSV